MAKISSEMTPIVVEGERDSSLVRYLQVREGVLPELERGKYPIRVDITWHYKGDANGLPNREVQEAFELFEEALIPALEKDKLALLSYQVTGEGERLWSFYTRHLAAFEERLNEATDHLPLYPLDLYAEQDVEIDALNEVLALL